MENPEASIFEDDDMYSYSQKLLANLTLLNYEKEYCKVKGVRTINEAYFTIQLNGAEQFSYFKGYFLNSDSVFGCSRRWALRCRSKNWTTR